MSRTSLMTKNEDKRSAGACRRCAGREIVLCALVIFFAAASGIILALYISKTQMARGSTGDYFDCLCIFIYEC